MWKAFINELKNNVFSSKWSTIKHLGIILLPLLYGFMYILAFFNPFAGSGALDIAVVVSQKDELGSAFANSLKNNKNDIKIGDLNMTLNINKVYASPNQIKDESWRKDEAKKHYATIFIKPTTAHTTLTEAFADTMFKGRKIMENPNLKISQKFTHIITQLSKLQMLEFYTNYQKNYLIAFGVDFSTAMQPIYKRMVNSVFGMDISSVWNLMNTKSFYTRYAPGLPPSVTPKMWAANTVNEYKTLWANMKSDKNHVGQTQLEVLLKGLDNVNVHSQMGNYAEYGFGLAPFFITLAMWIGSMGLTISVNGKIYKGKFSKKKIYMAKLFTIWISISIGAIILFIALAAIGFVELKGGYWRLLFQTIISGILLSSIVFAIRAAVPNKAAGIIIVLILLVLQMSVSGGLFSTTLQFPFFKFMNYIFPYTYSVHALREMTFDPNWLQWFIDIIIIMSFSVTSSLIGYYFWNKRKINEEEIINTNKIKRKKIKVKNV